MSIMARSRCRALLAAAGVVLAAGTTSAQDAVPRRLLPAHVSEAKAFFSGFLAPRMAARLGDDPARRAADAIDPTARAWTRDPREAARVGRTAAAAATSAVQQYALERLNADRWTIRLFHRGAEEASGDGTQPPGARLRFGVAHMRPRAEVDLPAGEARLAFSADLAGNFAASFESAGARVRVAASWDLRAHDASLFLAKRF